MKAKFKIDKESIMSNKAMTLTQSRMLIYLLEVHDKNNKKGNQVVYDADLRNELDKCKNTVFRTRKYLESEKMFKVVKVRVGNAQCNTYSFNWKKLETCGFIYRGVEPKDRNTLKNIVTSKRTIESKNNSPFLKISKIVKFSVDEGISDVLHRGSKILDKIDEFILIGESVNRTPENSYREHVVPCKLIINKAVDMYINGSSVQDIAIMIQQNSFIVLITKEEASYLDIDLGLRTLMPMGWEFGDNPLDRLNLAKIILKY